MNGVLEKGGAAREVRTHCQLPRYKSDFKKKKAESYVNGTSLWGAKKGGGDTTHTQCYVILLNCEVCEQRRCVSGTFVPT